MSILDLLASTGVLDLSAWRSAVPSVIGIGTGLAIYYLSGKDPAGAAVAFFLGILGICIGVIWQFSRRQHP
jgi:hypothetical protein